MDEIFLGNGSNLTIQTSTNVELKETLTLMSYGDEDESYTLEVSIKADFGTIPKKYHEVFLNMMTSKYYGKTSLVLIHLVNVYHLRKNVGINFGNNIYK